MKNIYLILSFFFSLLSFGQGNTGYTLVDAKMTVIPANATISTEAIAKYINANFKTETDKIRAVFYWTASTISYDVDNMFTTSAAETSQDKITKTLRTKKGVCIDYAEVFHEITHFLGLQSYIVQGYTKQNGSIGQLSHAWCAAKIDNKWYLFDPTWGAGGINRGVFVKKMNNSYFKVAPAKMISSHMPFDYLWQFLNYPINNQEFYEGKIQIDKTKKYFDFEGELTRYNQLSETNKLFETIKRMENNGVKNAMIAERLDIKKKNLAYLRQSSSIDKLNAVVNDYNQAIVMLNDFIYYRNNKFKPTLADGEIKRMIQIPRDMLVKCQEGIFSVGYVGSENASNLNSIKKGIIESLEKAEEHAQFVNQYLSKSKVARKAMFTKVIWHGGAMN